MPTELFLNENFPMDKIPGFDKAAAPSQFNASCCDDTVGAVSEPQAYEPFVSPSTEVWSITTIVTFINKNTTSRQYSQTSNLLIRLHSPIVIRSHVSHSGSNPTSLSTQTPLTMPSISRR